MKRTIYLARHAHHAEVGQILSGRSEITLDARGHEQARALTRRLAHVPLAAIHASPRRRASETAQAIAADHGLPVCEAPPLDEIDFGTWSGLSFATLDGDPLWRHWNDARSTAATPAGETMAAAVGRALDHIAAIVEEGPVLCVSHCDIIRGVVARVIGLDFDHLSIFDCDPASLTVIELEGESMRLLTLNERPQ